MTTQEWNSLTLEERKKASNKQESIDRYDADALRCRKDAERKIGVRYPQGGLSFKGVGSYGMVEISLGVDGERYRQCMEEAGWEVKLIIEKNRRE